MRKKILGVVLLFLFSTMATLAKKNDLPAFPGAEGGGKYTSGGRGGKVIYVTTLEDNSAAGSLRFAINQPGARIVVFAVSGTIQLKSNLNIKNADISIAGQTAPGDGICLRDFPVVIEADNVVIRFIRFRMGDEAKQQNDCIWGRDHKNIIIDHCSMSWSTDECTSFYDNENFTMQWCMISESLRYSVHGKGAHGYGGIWGGKNASFHHNLLADHDSRNPRFCGSRYSNRPDLELIDFRNNVIYNWGSNSSYGAEGGNYNMVNNYYKPGPATSSSSKSRILQPYADDGTNNQPKGTYGKFYITGNYVTSGPIVSNDNWQTVSLHSTFTTCAAGIAKNGTRSETEFSVTNVTTHTAQKAFEKVLDYVGSSLVRDTVDKRIIHDVQTGTATFMVGGNGSVNGIIDTQSAVGNWPELKSLPAPSDSDNDGMPDTWEDANGLHKNNPSDAQLTNVDGKFPNVEVYINSLVASITENQNKNALIGLFAQVKEQAEVFAPISMEPFGDSMRHWYGIHDDGNVVNPVANQPKYKETEITKIADNILIYQRNNGGWPKNYDMQAILTKAQVDSLVKTKDKFHTTFDNSTTYTHIEYLAKVYTVTHIEKYKDACLKGINFILLAQYSNGGWPQYYPLENNYSRRITFNDGAYLGIMEMLKKIVDNNTIFSFVGIDVREKVKTSYEKGLECILRMQITDKGRLTAWCQQHNEIDLSPAWARAYEPPGICNGESAPVVSFLMNIDQPDPKIIESIQSAVKWFNDSKIFNTREKTVPAPAFKSQYKTTTYDRVVVTDSTAPPIWTRFYELGTERPLFCDRNSKFLYSLAEVSRERRSGYGWYTYAPQQVLDKYPEWQRKWAPDKNVLFK